MGAHQLACESVSDLSMLAGCFPDIQCLWALLSIQPRITFETVLWLLAGLVLVITAVGLAACANRS